MGNLMYILIASIAALILWLIALYRSMGKLKVRHRSEMEQMQGAIASLTQQSGQQMDQLKLSDNLMVGLRQARERLDRELMGLQEDYARAVQTGPDS